MPSKTTATSPRDYGVHYEHWRQLDSLTIVQLAWMRRGVDPRLEEELPDWADSDLSDEIQLLLSAARAGTIEFTGSLAPPTTPANIHVKRNPQLISWLRDKGWNRVADGLDGQLSKESRYRTPAAVPRHRAQEEEILNELRRLGHNPVALPHAEPGKAGVKANVKQALSAPTGLFAGTTVFDKAWERLRASGAIRDA